MPKLKGKIEVTEDRRIHLKCTSDMYGITDGGGTAEHALKSGFVPLGDGCDYKLTDTDRARIKKLIEKIK